MYRFPATRSIASRLVSSLRPLLSLLMTLSFLLAACSAPAAQPTAAPEKKAAAPEKKAAEPATKSEPATSPAKASPTPAAPAKVEKIKLAYSATDASQIPMWVAKEQGFLLKNGLDAELFFVESGTKVVQTMIAGEIPIAAVGGSGVVEGITSGAELLIIASMGNAFPYKVIAAPSLKKAEDLKGKRLGVSRFGSSSDFSIRQAVKWLKLDPDKDVQVLQIGSDTVRTAALQAGSIDATVLNPPGTTILLRAGFNELLDMVKITDLEYQHTGIATSKAFIKSNRDTVLRFMKAIVEAIAFERSNKEATKKIIAKYSQMDDPDGVDDSYMQYNGPNGARLLQAAPYPTKGGIQMVIEEVLAGKSGAKKVTYDDVVDNSFVKELEDSGYIKSLYEKK